MPSKKFDLNIPTPRHCFIYFFLTWETSNFTNQKTVLSTHILMTWHQPVCFKFGKLSKLQLSIRQLRSKTAVSFKIIPPKFHPDSVHIHRGIRHGLESAHDVAFQQVCRIIHFGENIKFMDEQIFLLLDFRIYTSSNSMRFETKKYNQ